MLLISLICHTPIVSRGHPFTLWPFSVSWQWKNIKTGIGMTNWWYWSKYLPNGIVKWLLVKPWTSSIGRCEHYCTTALWWPSNNQQSGWSFSSLCCWLLPWGLLGQDGGSSCLMAASRGFWCSTGHTASANVLHIASMHLHGHCKSLRWRYICSLLPPFLFD